MELQRNECIDIYNSLNELEIAEISNGQVSKKNYFDGDTTFRIIHNKRVLKSIVDEVTETHNEMVKQHSTNENPNMVSPDRIADFNKVLNDYRKEVVEISLKKINYNNLKHDSGDNQNNRNTLSVSALQGILPILENTPE